MKYEPTKHKMVACENIEIGKTFSINDIPHMRIEGPNVQNYTDCIHCVNLLNGQVYIILNFIMVVDKSYKLVDD